MTTAATSPALSVHVPTVSLRPMAFALAKAAASDAQPVDARKLATNALGEPWTTSYGSQAARRPLSTTVAESFPCIVDRSTVSKQAI